MDKKVNDQANQFTLKASVNYKGVTYKKSDILSLTDSLFKSSNLLVDKNNLTVEAKNIKSQTNGVTADLTIHAKLIPSIDTDSLKNQIAGFPNSKLKIYLLIYPKLQMLRFQFLPIFHFCLIICLKIPAK